MRTSPNSTQCIESEQAVLSSVLCFAECIPKVAEIITPGEFFSETHRRIFSAIVQFHAEGKPVEIPALSKVLKKRDMEVVADLLDIAITGQTAPYYARQVAEAAKLRQIADIGAILRDRPDQLDQFFDQLTGLVVTPNAPTRSQFVPVSELLNIPLTIRYLIHGLIEKDTTGQLFGPSGGGKTFVAIDFACHIATGSPLNGQDVEQGLVLYCSGEGHSGLPRRVKAWMRHNGKSVDDLHYLHITRSTISIDGTGASAFISEARALADKYKRPVILIVIDTLARHIEGDENSTKDMGDYIKAVDHIRSAFPGCVVLHVHHTGHSEESKNRSRGSSALKGAMDFEIQCNKGLLTFTKMKDSAAPEPIPFKLRPVLIETDSNGETLTSCVVEYGERSVSNQEASLTPYEKMLLDLAGTHQNRGELRIAFVDKRKEHDSSLKYGALKTSFLRAIEGLETKKFIKVNGELIEKIQGTFGNIREHCSV